MWDSCKDLVQQTLRQAGKVGSYGVGPSHRPRKARAGQVVTQWKQLERTVVHKFVIDLFTLHRCASCIGGYLHLWPTEQVTVPCLLAFNIKLVCVCRSGGSAQGRSCQTDYKACYFTRKSWPSHSALKRCYQHRQVCLISHVFRSP